MIPSEKSVFDYSVASHPGKGMETNEDRYHIEAFSLSEKGDGDSLIAILADGVGSRRAGQVAAEIAVETVALSVAESDASQPLGVLQAGFHRASKAILFRSEVRPEWEGMGSTCLSVWLVADRLFIASVGTSRCYLLRGKTLMLLNDPEAIRKGVKESKIVKDPAGYLGAATPVRIDTTLGQAGRHNEQLSTRGLRLHHNDRILLCTDGVGDALYPREIIELVGHKDVHMVAQSLVNLALEKGTSHNLTAAVIAVPPGRPPTAKAALTLRRVMVVSILVLLLTVSGMFSLWLWQVRNTSPPPPQTTPIDTLTPIPSNTPE
jgi:PPM family protein phosphatase